MRITEKELKILEELQKNSKVSINYLAKKLKTPTTTLYDKIRRMEQEGVIKKYTTIIDHTKIGKPAIALVFITIKERYGSKGKIYPIRNVAEKIAKFDRVLELYMILGKYDIVAKVIGKSEREIGGFIIDKLRSIKGIDKTWTNILIAPVKEYGIVK